MGIMLALPEGLQVHGGCQVLRILSASISRACEARASLHALQWPSPWLTEQAVGGRGRHSWSMGVKLPSLRTGDRHAGGMQASIVSPAMHATLIPASRAAVQPCICKRSPCCSRTSTCCRLYMAMAESKSKSGRLMAAAASLMRLSLRACRASLRGSPARTPLRSILLRAWRLLRVRLPQGAGLVGRSRLHQGLRQQLAERPHGRQAGQGQREGALLPAPQGLGPGVAAQAALLHGPQGVPRLGGPPAHALGPACCQGSLGGGLAALGAVGRQGVPGSGAAAAGPVRAAADVLLEGGHVQARRLQGLLVPLGGRVHRVLCAPLVALHRPGRAAQHRLPSAFGLGCIRASCLGLVMQGGTWGQASTSSSMC